MNGLGNLAGKVSKTSGFWNLISSGIQSYGQAQMYNENKKWLSDHVAGQVKGNVDYAAGYGDPSKWQNSPGAGGPSSAAGQSAQTSGLA